MQWQQLRQQQWQRWKLAWFDPRAYVQGLLKDKANRQDYWPGTRALLWMDLFIFVLVLVLMWSLFGFCWLALALLGWRIPGMWPVLVGAGAAGLSPVSLACSFAVDAGQGFICLWALCHCVDGVFRRFFGHAGGLQIPLFNALMLASLPWIVFMVVPVLGWVLAMVGSTVACYLVLSQLYQQRDPAKVIVAAVIAVIPVILLSLALTFALLPLNRTVRRLDPLQPWLEDHLEPSTFSGLFSGSAVGSGGNDASNEVRLKQLYANVLPLYEEGRHLQVPGATPGDASPAPLATEVVAAAPTAVPSPSPSMGQAVGKVVAQEATRQGVNDALRAIRLFR